MVILTLWARLNAMTGLKTFLQKSPRGKIKDRRDVGRGCFFGGPPIPFFYGQSIIRLFFFSYFLINVHEIIFNNLINCSFYFSIVFFF